MIRRSILTTNAIYQTVTSTVSSATSNIRTGFVVYNIIVIVDTFVFSNEQDWLRGRYDKQGPFILLVYFVDVYRICPFYCPAFSF